MAKTVHDPVPGLVITVTGDDLDLHGNGIARWQNWVIVVPSLLPGEVAKVQITAAQTITLVRETHRVSAAGS